MQDNKKGNVRKEETDEKVSQPLILKGTVTPSVTMDEMWGLHDFIDRYDRLINTPLTGSVKIG